MTATCPSCGRAAAASAQYCVRCGFPLPDRLALRPEADPLEVSTRPATSSELRLGVGLLVLLAAGIAVATLPITWTRTVLGATMMGHAVALAFLAAMVPWPWRRSLSIPRRADLAWFPVALAALLALLATLPVYPVPLDSGGLVRSVELPRSAWWPFLPVLALGEEILFRGALLHHLGLRFGQRRANLLQAGIFAAMHLRPGAAPYEFAAGFLFGALATRTKSIWPGFALHLAWNAVLFR